VSIRPTGQQSLIPSRRCGRNKAPVRRLLRWNIIFLIFIFWKIYEIKLF
jgi:hypothetical protein